MPDIFKQNQIFLQRYLIVFGQSFDIDIISGKIFPEMFSDEDILVIMEINPEQRIDVIGFKGSLLEIPNKRRFHLSQGFPEMFIF